jgi:hypothetical protein
MSSADKAAAPKTRPSFDGWALATTALVAVLVVLVNYVSARRYERWDLTRDRLFTLSERTDNLLKGLAKPVDIYVFLGSGEPSYQDLRELVSPPSFACWRRSTACVWGCRRTGKPRPSWRCS